MRTKGDEVLLPIPTTFSLCALNLFNTKNKINNKINHKLKLLNIYC